MTEPGPDCPECSQPTELRGTKRTPYCRHCHQFVVDGVLGECRSRPADADVTFPEDPAPASPLDSWDF